MSNKNDAGVYQKENGFWEYRFTIVVNGTRISKKKGTDELGNKLRTKRDAKKAREATRKGAQASNSSLLGKLARCTDECTDYAELYMELCCGRKCR